MLEGRQAPASCVAASAMEQRAIACCPATIAIVHCSLVESGVGTMAGQEFRLLTCRLGKLLLQCRCDAPMQRLALRAEQALVGGIPDQGMLEAVDDLGRRSAAGRPAPRREAGRARRRARLPRTATPPRAADRRIPARCRRRLAPPLSPRARGPAVPAMRPAAWQESRSGGPAAPASTTALVSSSMNKGTPSAPRRDLGHDLRRQAELAGETERRWRRSTPRPRRLRVSRVMCGARREQAGHRACW